VTKTLLPTAFKSSHEFATYCVEETRGCNRNLFLEHKSFFRQFYKIQDM